MPRREDHEVHKDMWWGHLTQKNFYGMIFVVELTGSNTF
jgi:hypothetical protein